MNFGMILLNQSIKTEQNYATWILTALLFIFIFIFIFYYIIKRRLMFENYADCLFNDKIILKLQQRFKSVYHNVYTEQINKIALSSNNDKRLQTSDKFTT